MKRRGKDRPKATHQAYDQYEMWTFPLLRDIPEIEHAGRQQFRKATPCGTEIPQSEFQRRSHVLSRILPKRPLKSQPNSCPHGQATRR